MPELKINKPLNRPDGQIIPPGAIASCNTPRFVISEQRLVFPTNLYFDAQAQSDKKQPVPAIKEFKFNKLVKDCTEAEWIEVNTDPNAGEIVGKFYQEVVEAKLGVGETEIL